MYKNNKERFLDHQQLPHPFRCELMLPIDLVNKIIAAFETSEDGPDLAEITSSLGPFDAFPGIGLLIDRVEMMESRLELQRLMALQNQQTTGKEQEGSDGQSKGGSTSAYQQFMSKEFSIPIEGDQSADQSANKSADESSNGLTNDSANERKGPEPGDRIRRMFQAELDRRAGKLRESKEPATCESAALEFCGPPVPPALQYPPSEERKAGKDITVHYQDLIDTMMSDHPYYNQPREGYVRVFTAANLKSAMVRMARDRERMLATWVMVKSMAKDNGYRSLVEISRATELELEGLKQEFINFTEVIDRIIRQVISWPYCRHDQRRITPILLEGIPGVGKSYFCERLAKVLKVGYKRIDLGTITAGMALTGSTSQWSNAQPGILVEEIASSTSASNLWFLDEINMAKHHSNSPVMPVLLGLLEPHNARCVRDDYCGIEFDLSHSIFIAACNDTNEMLPALLSRFERFRIASPSSKQRRVVANNLLKQAYPLFDVEERALDQIASVDLGLRELRRVMQQCAEKLIAELRRRGSKQGMDPSLPRPKITELHAREVIRDNGYKLKKFEDFSFNIL